MSSDRAPKPRRQPRTARRSAVSVVAVVAVLVAAAGCSSSAAPPGGATPGTAAPGTSAPAAATVTVKLFQFAPTSVTVAAGQPVTFTNGDDTTHEPMSGAPGAVTPAFDVPLRGQGATATVTLPGPGTYPYFCAIHDSMRGEIVVR